MDNQERYEFEVQMTAKNLWNFSMHHVSKGYLGLFNVIFSVASLFLLVTSWSEHTVPYRLLLILCVSMFTVLQPGQLYLKAKRQASLTVMKEPIHFTFTREGMAIRQGKQEQELTWDQVGKVEKGRHMLVVYMDRIHAYLITDEAMGTQKETFCAMLRDVLPKERRKRI